MKMILLTAAEPASFAFWFLTELFFAAVVVLLLYFFIVKNPKINKPRQRDEDEV